MSQHLIWVVDVKNKFEGNYKLLWTVFPILNSPMQSSIYHYKLTVKLLMSVSVFPVTDIIIQFYLNYPRNVPVFVYKHSEELFQIKRPAPWRGCSVHLHKSHQWEWHQQIKKIFPRHSWTGKCFQKTYRLAWWNLNWKCFILCEIGGLPLWAISWTNPNYQCVCTNMNNLVKCVKVVYW